MGKWEIVKVCVFELGDSELRTAAAPSVLSVSFRIQTIL